MKVNDEEYTFGITDQFNDKTECPELKWKIEIQNKGPGVHNPQIAMNTIARAFRESDIHPANEMRLQKQGGDARPWGCRAEDLQRESPNSPWRMGPGMR